MALRHTAFYPQRHGFAFANAWDLDDVERQRLGGDLTAYFIERGTMGPLGRLIVPSTVRLVRRRLQRLLAPTYGLCGGMVFAALDFHRAGLPLPRGEHARDLPPPGSPMRRYIWRRQLDTLISDARRFVSWTAALRRSPSKGAARLLSHSLEEWSQLRRSLDDGEPVPIGLVREGRNVFDNHQVLATGYAPCGPRHVRLYLYDPNCPNREATITIEFGKHQLTGLESCPLGSRVLRGFFCEPYTSADPTQALG